MSENWLLVLPSSLWSRDFSGPSEYCVLMSAKQVQKQPRGWRCGVTIQRPPTGRSPGSLMRSNGQCAHSEESQQPSLRHVAVSSFQVQGSTSEQACGAQPPRSMALRSSQERTIGRPIPRMSSRSIRLRCRVTSGPSAEPCFRAPRWTRGARVLRYRSEVGGGT